MTQLFCDSMPLVPTEVKVDLATGSTDLPRKFWRHPGEGGLEKVQKDEVLRQRNQ